MTGLSGFDLATYNNPASNAAQVHGGLLLFFCSDLEMKTFPSKNPENTTKRCQLMDCVGHCAGYFFIYLFIYFQTRDNLGCGRD